MKSSKKLSRAEIKDRILNRGVDQLIERKHLEAALSSGKTLRVKLGIDPTSPDLHLGHAVVLRKLRDFQDLGHKVIFIIGDFTAKVGDPSGRSKERPVLNDQEIRTNMRGYLEQAGKIIDVKKTEVRYNSEWLSGKVENVLELAKAATINQVSERADFRARIKAGQKVSMLEGLYSLLQGLDSVNIKADVELGGNDQLLNLLMGRQVQRHYEMKEQDILTVPLLEGTDGIGKMSKSKGNYIALNETAKEMFGKIMSIPDKLVYKYFELCTDVEEKELRVIRTALGKKNTNPMGYKLRLAEKIVAMYHGEKEALKAREEFINVFRKKALPKEIPTIVISGARHTPSSILSAAEIVSSKSAAQRLIEQGGVRINNEKVNDPKRRIKISKGRYLLLQVGKRKFLRIRLK
ncbi:MAG: Tyrosine-tRNA ligase [Candidatus Nomurabacteria bacterium GW2011_GWA1_46_11]|uniref:Tyrosine--tRNA ligase n=2 Tax=Parcubacteria group TaxID=1794811 RepID=A0A1G1YW61_9BACT|nr:MAG: Tyrosine-tRNA ligase [Parcubacteria group bacterium GW2011_GWA2_46_10]KKU20999.1 MAG: Tyrosine-tRNA ligase [Candidatus Nomurabacteria bacterium GW2011_GWA1_46_11]OGY56623.1 MAG: tyrosine--tRNA ligase [Candidatus Colwellbacteria bacterium GWA2_46_10]